MAKKSGTTAKQGGIKSWMNHLFTKGNKKKANNIVEVVRARSTIDSLSEKDTTGSRSIARSSSTATATTTTTQASSIRNNKVTMTLPPIFNTELQPVEERSSVPGLISSNEVTVSEENQEDNMHYPVGKDQQTPDDISAPIEVFWKHGGQDVYVTGTFDDWSKSVRMEKRADGVFVAELRPSDHTMWYKFVVDGIWQHDSSQPIEKDNDGNTNNVIHLV